MNVLLLTLSDLKISENNNYCLRESSYICEEDNSEDCIRVTGYGQLEPVPKYLIQKLKRIGEKLDKIVVLCTTEVREPVEFRLNPDSELLRKSSIDFFADRIHLEDSDVIIQTIDTKRDAFDETVVKVTRALKENNVNLYVDMHGGPREYQLVIDAIISTLKNYGVTPKQSYTVPYGKEKKGNDFLIRKTDKYMDIFSLSSGINEFIHYGRSFSLAEFLSSINPKLASAVNKISDSLQLCNMDEFEENLKELNSLLNDSTEEESSYIPLIFDALQFGYGNLLEKNHSISDTLEWCLNNEFYQQALTIIESRVPKFILEKVIRFDWNQTVTIRDYPNYGQNTSVSLNTIDFNLFLDYKKWQNKENYVFEKCCSNVVNRTPEGERIYIPLKDKSLGKMTKDYLSADMICSRWIWDYQENKYAYCRVGVSNLKRYSTSEKYMLVDEPGKRTTSVKISFSAPEEQRKLFNQFLQLHFALKNQRNAANHAAEAEVQPGEHEKSGNSESNNISKEDKPSATGRESLSDIKQAIKLYIFWLRLLNHENVQER